jgi:FkbM family methyltransferase
MKEFVFHIRKDSNDTEIIREVFTQDAYRLQELKIKEPCLDKIVDVGGHIGTFAFLAALLWPGSNITTIEPDEESFGLLQKNCASCEFVKPVFGAVIGEDQEGWRFLPYREFPPHATNTGGGRMMPEGSRPVPTFRIKEFIFNGGVDLLKLDCEGMEGAILQSAKEAGLLTSIRRICGEYHGTENQRMVDVLLKNTHKIVFPPTEQRWGLFFAVLKK